MAGVPESGPAIDCGTGFGVVAVGGYVFLAAQQALLVEHLLSHSSAFVYVVISVGSTAMLYLLCGTFATRRGEASHADAPVRTSASGDFFALNVFTAGAWLGFYSALAYSDPEIIFAVTRTIGPGLTMVLDGLMRRRRSLSRIDVAVAGASALTALWLFYSKQSHMPPVVSSASSTLIAVGLATVAGASTAGMIVVSKRLAEQRYQSRKILAHRFYGIFLIAAVAILLGSDVVSLQTGTVLRILAITATTVIPSLYLLPTRVGRTEPNVTAVILQAFPAVSLVLEVVEGDARLSAGELLPVLATTGLVAPYG